MFFWTQIVVEKHDFWQKIFDQISGSQKRKYFIQLWVLIPLVMPECADYLLLSIAYPNTTTPIILLIILRGGISLYLYVQIVRASSYYFLTHIQPCMHHIGSQDRENILTMVNMLSRMTLLKHNEKLEWL